MAIFRPKNGFLTSKMSFPEHVTNRKVVDNDEFYLNMHFQPNRWSSSEVNGQKPSKMAIFSTKLLIKKNLGFFRKKRRVSFLPL